jgi:hypothetical protein
LLLLALREVVVSERFDIGDRVEITKVCIHLAATPAARCALPGATGMIYDLTPANDGPEEGHGTFVKLDCPHMHAVALARDEMRIA